jgi:hypothetical protein
MATKTELITFIIENSKDFSFEELDKLKKNDLQEIVDALEIYNDEVDSNDIIKVNITDDDFEAIKTNHGIKLTKEMIDDLIFNNEDYGDEDSYVVEEVEEEWDLNKLSPNDQRLYYRTGIKKITKTIKYTRFNNEKPKI